MDSITDLDLSFGRRHEGIVDAALGLVEAHSLVWKNTLGLIQGLEKSLLVAGTGSRRPSGNSSSSRETL